MVTERTGWNLVEEVAAVFNWSHCKSQDVKSRRMRVVSRGDGFRLDDGCLISGFGDGKKGGLAGGISRS